MDDTGKQFQELQAVLGALDKVQAVIWFDTDGNILEANENFCSALGYRPDELIGRHHRMFVDSAYSNSGDYQAFWRRLGNGEFITGEFTRYAKDGSAVYIDASYNAIRDGDGNVVKVVKFANDITERKIRNARFEAQLGAISRSQAVIEFKPDGSITTANENFLNATGYQLSEIEGKHHRIFVDREYANSAEYREFWNKLSNGEFFASEFKRLTKTGADIWIQASYNPIFDPSGNVTGIIKFATDITQRKQKMEQLIEGVVATSNSIAQEAEAISATSNELSKRSETQAATVEQTSAAMEQISASVSSNAKNAQGASEEAKAANAQAEKGGQVVEQAISAMKKIEDGSKEIRKFIEVIDSIAFQTNLLALNAGVEAARAGDAGRGFAVVASEVRALAQRASESAKDINALIDNSSKEVAEGARLVNETGTVLAEIIDGVVKVADGIENINTASAEQASGVQEINQAISDIDKTTQRNASLAEESAEAAGTLARNSAELLELISQFDAGKEVRNQRPHKLAQASQPRQSPKVAVNETATYRADDDAWTEF
ncbi:MAG: PAS domain-containing methyl-accepting chemotaxis protein [Silicimonas sp.]|nr:PAS domain-containing methyl-accepting chemotaxis protein [Silicimonas sp.]